MMTMRLRSTSSGAAGSPEMQTSAPQPECIRTPKAALFMLAKQHVLRRKRNLFDQPLSPSEPIHPVYPCDNHEKKIKLEIPAARRFDGGFPLSVPIHKSVSRATTSQK